METKLRGFAAMTPERRKEIASMGGRASNGKNLTREARAKGGRNSKRGTARNKSNE